MAHIFAGYIRLSNNTATKAITVFNIIGILCRLSLNSINFGLVFKVCLTSKATLKVNCKSHTSSCKSYTVTRSPSYHASFCAGTLTGQWSHLLHCSENLGIFAVVHCLPIRHSKFWNYKRLQKEWHFNAALSTLYCLKVYFWDKIHNQCSLNPGIFTRGMWRAAPQNINKTDFKKSIEIIEHVMLKIVCTWFLTFEFIFPQLPRNRRN